MNTEVTAYLEKDHRTVEQLFADILDSNDATRRKALFHAVDGELSIHAEGEEAILYPRARREEALQDLTAHSEDEHQEIKDKLTALRETDVEDRQWMTLLRDLKACVSHHVEEEEKELFPKMRELWSESERKELGAALIEAKEKVYRLAAAERSVVKAEPVKHDFAS